LSAKQQSSVAAEAAAAAAAAIALRENILILFYFIYMDPFQSKGLPTRIKAIINESLMVVDGR
jgi:hypothetical protein